MAKSAMPKARFRSSGRQLIRLVLKNVVVRKVLYARRGALPRWLWRRLPVEGVFPVTLPNGTSFLYSSTANDGIGRSLYWRGLESWEKETIQPFLELAREAHIVLDVGANTGIFTLLACGINPDCQVISFEPVPRVYNRLIGNIELNGWQTRCQARQEAVSNFVGRAQFHIPFADLPTSSSLHVHGFRGYQGELANVPVTTLDTVCASLKGVDLVKIDVEGFEDKVLEGMQRVLAASTPFLIIECNSDGPAGNIEAILSGFGYRFFHLCPDGAKAVSKIVPDADDRYRNFLCVARGDGFWTPG